MAQFEKNGINDSTALAAMKAAVKNSVKEGKSLSEALGDNIRDIKNATSETEALQIATELFGSKGAAEMVNAIKEGRIDFDDLSGSMSSYKDTVKKTYDATLDPLEESKQVINNLKLAGADLAATALKEGQPLIEDVIDGVKGVTNWLKKLTPEEKKTLTEAIKIVAVAGPAVTIGGKLTKGIGSIVGLLPKMVSAFTSLTASTTCFYKFDCQHNNGDRCAGRAKHCTERKSHWRSTYSGWFISCRNDYACNGYLTSS